MKSFAGRAGAAGLCNDGSEQDTMMNLPINQIICGDVLDVLRMLPDACVDCCVTSPPYWGLRDYGVEPGVWDGDSACEHEWQEHVQPAAIGIIHAGGMSGETLSDNAATRKPKRSQFCRLCGAWRGCYGLEPTMDLYVRHTVVVFREVRRVLADHGTCWLNLGDSYTSGGQKTHGTRIGYKQESNAGCLTVSDLRPELPAGLKPKDLCGIPWRVAFALQADGWWLRQDIIWAKPNPMPESVTDRCTKAHEYIFLLTKRARYFYDAEAIKEDMVEYERDRRLREGTRGLDTVYSIASDGKTGQQPQSQSGSVRNAKRRAELAVNGSRNKRSVWTIATQPMPEAHFATFPEALVEPCVLAGCPREVCRICGKPRERIVQKFDSGRKQKMPDGFATYAGDHGSIHKDGREAGKQNQAVMEAQTVGWTDCGCGAGFRPGIVLDPFGGSGTVGVVAARLKRGYILIELNEKYVEEIAKPRLAHVEIGVPVMEQRAGQIGLFERRDTSDERR
jgi:DNA modification methylase